MIARYCETARALFPPERRRETEDTSSERSSSQKITAPSYSSSWSFAHSFVRSFLRSQFGLSLVHNLDLFRAITAIRVHLNNRSLIVVRLFPSPPVPSSCLPAAYTLRREIVENGTSCLSIHHRPFGKCVKDVTLS